MREKDLPTADQMLARADWWLDVAYKILGDAANELRSDWQPRGTPLTAAQAASRTVMLEGIGNAKGVIDETKRRAGL